jgi:hypothetical protein
VAAISRFVNEPSANWEERIFERSKFRPTFIRKVRWIERWIRELVGAALFRSQENSHRLQRRVRKPEQRNRPLPMEFESCPAGIIILQFLIVVSFHTVNCTVTRSRAGPGEAFSGEMISPPLLASIGIAHNQFPRAVALAPENTDRLVVNWDRLSRVIDRRTLEVGGQLSDLASIEGRNACSGLVEIQTRIGEADPSYC